MIKLFEKIIQESVVIDNDRVDQVSAVAMTYDTLEELCYEFDIDNDKNTLEEELTLPILIMEGEGIKYKFVYFA